MSLEARLILKKYWGYDSFRACQEEIVDSILDGHDTLGLMPTGGGKSITFQVPALMMDGLTVVITPLISLMNDQVENLHARHIKAIALHSGLSMRERRVALNHLDSGRVKILYVSPEKVATENFASLMRRSRVSLIVVDEAHCISQWGHDFRPSYLEIADVRRQLPGVPVLALTASATPAVVEDITTQLKFGKDHRVHRLSFSRQNLSYIVRRTDDKRSKLIEILSKIGGCAIVYVRSRKRTLEIAQLLASSGIPALPYHAGIQSEVKADYQRRWKQDEVRVMVATTAFGMGIDKPDVRLVIHYDIPPSLEEYYQEAGRAGRDGRESLAVLLTNKSDAAVLSRRLSIAFPPRDFIKELYGKMCVFLNVAMEEGYETLHEFNLKLFSERHGLQPAQVASSLSILARSGYIEYQEDYNSLSRVMIVMRRDELYNLRLAPEAESVLKMLLRTYTGLFADYEYISESVIASRTGLTEQTVYDTFLQLARMHVLHYVPRKNNPMIYMRRSRVESRHVVIPLTVYEHRKLNMQRQIEAVKKFALNDGECRTNVLLRYFGETPDEDCGKCDQCRERLSRERTKRDSGSLPLDELVMHLIDLNSPVELQRLIDMTGRNPERVIDTVRELIDQGRVRLNDTLLYIGTDK